MSLDQMVADAVYDTLVAEDATYIDASGAETAVRVIPGRDAAILLGAADIGVRGVRQAFYLRKTSIIHRPCKGDRIVYGSDSYCVAATADDYSTEEWLIYVTA